MKYTVKVKEVHTVEIEVEAESTADARSKVNELLASGEADIDDLVYSHTLEPEEWEVKKRLTYHRNPV